MNSSGPRTDPYGTSRSLTICLLNMIKAIDFHMPGEKSPGKNKIWQQCLFLKRTKTFIKI